MSLLFSRGETERGMMFPEPPGRWKGVSSGTGEKLRWGLLWVEIDLSRTELRSRPCDFLWPRKIPRSAKGEPVSESQLCRHSDGHGQWSTDEEGWSQPGQILSSCLMGSFPGVDQCLWKVQLLQRSAIDQEGWKTSGGDRDK